MESPEEAVAKVEKALENYIVGEWEFMYIRTSDFLRAAMTADRIRTSCEIKLLARHPASYTKRLKAFVKAFRASSFTLATSHLDIRYGFIVRDNRSREIMTIFQDSHNQMVVINGATYRVTGALTRWFIDLARATTDIL